MARGNAIILTADPKGIFDEGIISGTPKPGTFLEIVPDTEPVSGRFTWRARSAASGAKGPVVVLLNNWEEGQLTTTAFVTGVRCKMYWPLPGDDLNALVAESSGTGTSGENALGDRLAINSSGMLMSGGSLATQPFYLLDRTGLDAYATTLRFVKYLGSFA